MSGGLHAWGWIMTILSAVQLLAAAGVWAGNQLARWFAVAVVGLGAIGQMFFIPACPFWSLVIIAADVVALWGLCAHGNRENPVPPSYFDGAGVVLKPLDQRRPLLATATPRGRAFGGLGWQVQASSLHARPVRHPD